MTRTLAAVIIAGLSAAGAPPSIAATAARTKATDRPIAGVVYWVEGPARVVPAKAVARRLGPFDWLRRGDRVEVLAGGTLLLATIEGRRYELKAGAAATVEAGALTSLKDPVRELPPLPPLPLPALSKEDHPGLDIGAIRVRTGRIEGLWPDDGRALAGETVLVFTPESTARRYRLELRDEEGEAVFNEDVAAACVAVPGGVLRPGHQYRWSAQALTGPLARGDATFTTLSSEEERRRSEWRAKVAAVADPRVLGLATEVDRQLGLLPEATDVQRRIAACAPAKP